MPFYEKICEVTGLRNIAQADARGERAGRHDAQHSHRVRYQRAQPAVAVHAARGRDRRASGRGHAGGVRRRQHRQTGPITGQAIPSYGPQYAAQYFRKLDCFCFAKQTLQPGESRAMPVVFVIDPAAPRELTTISLSYTFFEVEGNGRS